METPNMMTAYIKAIEYALPNTELNNDTLAEINAEWSVEKIEEKTGIRARRIAAQNECASDLGVQAADKLFSTHNISPDDIDYLLFCTQSPDYLLPTTACIMQDRLQLPKTCGALDFNLGCSGYVYGLGLAKGLVESSQAANILLITAETYSKFIHEKDRSIRTIFGDGASATLIQSKIINGKKDRFIGPFVYGSDGTGYKNLIVPAGSGRLPISSETSKVSIDEYGNSRSQNNLYMNGPEIFNFTLREVPKSIDQLFAKSGYDISDVDIFIFHQANKFILNHLRKKLKIPKEKFYMSFRDYGNTVSSTIPIALHDAIKDGKISHGDVVLLAGFGVGYSWGSTLIRWHS